MTAQYAAKDPKENEFELECVSDIRPTKSRRSKVKTAEECPYTILSPEAAVEFVNDQDLVFGTCSQLETEDSPQTLRELQQAIRDSENLAYSGDPTRNRAIPRTTESPTRSVSRMTGTRNLWRVAARDTDGSLIQSKALNVIDLTDRTESTPQKIPEKVDQAPNKSPPKDWFEHEFSDIDSPPEKRPFPSKLSDKASGSATQLSAPTPTPTPTVAPAPAPPAQSTIADTTTKSTDIASN